MAFDIERMKKVIASQRSIQWEGWKWHEYAKSDRWYPSSRDPHDGMFYTLFRDYGRVPGALEEIVECIEALNVINDRLHKLHHDQQEHEMLAEYEKHDLDQSSYYMALYGALHLGTSIRSLERALTASTRRSGHWYTLARRAERVEQARQAEDLAEMLDSGPLSGLR